MDEIRIAAQDSPHSAPRDIAPRAEALGSVRRRAEGNLFHSERFQK
jgi:hypothetical protein